ncbi:MAG TPA: hypothetical protein VHP30_14055 [Ignavibacteriales bacterium]|nr:hypothetical protein [Ignavibacteriales bacterium]
MRYKNLGSLPSLIKQSDRKIESLEKDVANLDIVINRKQIERREKQRQLDIERERKKSNEHRLLQEEINEGEREYFNGGLYAN